jgi:hypothetical protein
MFSIHFKYGQGITIFCGILFCFLSLIKLQQKQLFHNVLLEDKNTYLKQEQYLQTAVKLQQKMPVFGFDNLFANWNYLQFIQYFGYTEARNVTGYSVVTNYFETVVEHDPNFVQSHLVMSSANSLFAAKPEKTVELLNKALETVKPEIPYYPFLLWTYKATDEILFLGDLESAQNSYTMAANWTKLRQDELGRGLSQRYQQTTLFLATNPDPDQVQFGAWMSILSGSQDRKTQDYILNKLKSLGAEITIDANGKLNIKPPQQVGANGRSPIQLIGITNHNHDR